MVKLTGLNLMERNDDSFEEINVFFSQRNSKTTDNTSQDIQKFSSSIEFIVLMDKCIETISDSLSNHLSPWNELSIESMKNIL